MCISVPYHAKFVQGFWKVFQNRNEGIMEFDAVVVSPVGLHARPAALFVKKVASSGLKVTVSPIVDGEIAATADAKIILSILALGIKSGQTVRVVIEGDNPETLAAELQEILADPEG
mgnify:FL=1